MGLESTSFIAGLVETNPVGASDDIKQGDDHLRLIKTVLKATFPTADHAIQLDRPQTDIGSATTSNIGAVASNFVRITGSTTITGFGTIGAGIWRFIRFAGALTLTHNATSLILPGGADITTAANDTALAMSLGSGNWIVLFYQTASGAPVGGSEASGITFAPTGSVAATNVQNAIAEVDSEKLAKASNLSDVGSAATAFDNIKQAASLTATGVAELATAAEMVAGTDSTRVPAVNVIKNHEGVAKAWAYCLANGTLQDSYGVTSIVRNSTGNYTITLTDTMANALYAVTVGVEGHVVHSVQNRTTTTFVLDLETVSGNAADRDFSVAVLGTLA